ncbi:MAG: GC-type dockerin domain-anchored protein [Planctomycetota bacterium]
MNTILLAAFGAFGTWSHTADPPEVRTFADDRSVSGFGFDLTGNHRYAVFGDGGAQLVFIFDRLTSDLVRTLEPDQTDASDYSRNFGEDPVIWNDLLLFGDANDPSLPVPSGSLYVVDINTGERITKIPSPDPQDNDFFGGFNAVHGDTLVTSAIGRGTPGENSGRLYVYTLPDLELVHNIGDINSEEDVFPFGVALNDDYIFARRSPLNPTSPGDTVLLMYDRITGELVAEETITFDGETARFGLSIAASERWVLVADLSFDTPAENAGAVFVFDIETRKFVGIIQASQPQADDTFGQSIDIRGNIAAIGAQDRPDGSNDYGFVELLTLPEGRFLRRIDAIEPDPSINDFSWTTTGGFGSALEFVDNGVLVGAPFSSFDATGHWIPVPELCPADTNLDRQLNMEDFNAWVLAFNSQSPACDENSDGLCTPADFNAWVLNFNAGCP